MAMKGKLFPLIAALTLLCMSTAQAQQKPAAGGKKQNIVVFWATTSASRTSARTRTG